MKFNKESIMVLIAIMAFVISAYSAFAQSDSATLISNQDSSLNLNEDVSGLKIPLKQADIWFTFNQEKKVEKELDLARLRLIQAKIAAENNNIVAMEKALEAHERIIEKVQKRIDSVDGEIKAEKIKNSAEKLIAMEKAIEVHEARIEKLRIILDEGNLTDEQRAKIEEKLGKAEDNTAHLKEVQLAKEEQIKTKLRAVSNANESEVDNEIKEIEDSKQLPKTRQLIAENKIADTERHLERLSQLTIVTEEKNNTELASFLKNESDFVNECLLQAKEQYNAGEYEKSIQTLKAINNYVKDRHYMRRDSGLENKEQIKGLIKEANDAQNAVRQENQMKNDKLVGEDRDKHGCIGSAGYSWCEEKQKCLRIWEENCSAESD